MWNPQSGRQPSFGEYKQWHAAQTQMGNVSDMAASGGYGGSSGGLPIGAGGIGGSSATMYGPGSPFGASQPGPTMGGIGHIGAIGGGGLGGVPEVPVGGGFGDTLKGWIGSAVDWAKQNPDLILGAIGAYQSAKDSREAKKLREKAVSSAEDDYASREPFRAALMEALANGSLRAPSSPSAPSQTTAVRSLTGAEEAARKALTG